MPTNTLNIHVKDLPAYFENLIKPYTNQVPFVFWVVIFLAFITTSALTPVVMTDTDMWYHLTSGKYLFENGTIPTSTFFSFLEARNWANYYWGFQALAYKSHELIGYQGLILLKATIFTITAFTISKLISNNNIQRINYPQLFIISLFFSLFIARGELIRPHLFTYMFIPLTLYVLTHQQKRLWLLPIITVLWSNTHGITWPVGAAILGSFTLQAIYQYRINNEKHQLNLIFWCAISAPFIFLNPNGIDILSAPFASDKDI